MAQQNNSDLLDKDKLSAQGGSPPEADQPRAGATISGGKPELEDLAARILRQDKNIEKVKIEEKITAKARSFGSAQDKSLDSARDRQAAPRTAKRRQGLPRTAAERQAKAGAGKEEDKESGLSAPSTSLGAGGSGRDGSQQDGSPGQGSGQAGQAEKEAGEEGAGNEPQSLRERVLAARQLKELAKKKLAATVTAPAKQGISRLLQMAWLNLIDSFGLTLIWINIHVFLRWVLGEKLFCKLGEEWLPKQIAGAGLTAQTSAGAAGSAGSQQATEPVAKGIGLVEVIVLLILDLIVLFVIFIILALIVMIVDFMQAGLLEKIKMFIGGLTNLGWSGIKALYDLFVGL